MKISVVAAALVLALGATTACTTHGTFVIPEGTQLELYRRPPVVPGADGLVVTKPFFWTAAGIPPRGGVEYRILKGGEVVQAGRLRAKFRVASIFWPPLVGLAIWPMGLNPDITYDLVEGTQK